MPTIFAAGLAAAACGSDSNTSPQTATATPTAVSATPYAVPEGYLAFVSASKRYSIVYPKDWTPKQDFAKIGDFASDEFLGPIQGGGQVNIGVTNCAMAPTDVSSEELVNQSVKLFAKNESVSTTEMSSRSGTGSAAEFTVPIFSKTIEYTMFGLVQGGCARLVILATPEGRRDEYRDVFRTMVESLKNN